MNKEIIKNTRLGLFVLAGTILLVVGLYLIGSNSNMFSKTFSIYATFRNVNGLQKGNNVRYAGIDIGTIKDIKIINDTVIRVEMSLIADSRRVIRKNSLASIGTDGLMGDKIINIAPGSPEMGLINEREELNSIPTINTEEMLRTLSITNKNVAVISENLRNITQTINEGRGTLYTVLMDTNMALKIKHTLGNIDVVSNNILSISSDLNNVVTDVKQGKGMLGTLVKDTIMTTDLAQAVKDIKDAGEQINNSAGQLKQLLQKVNSGNGTISTLINDTASANSLKRSLGNIEVSTQKFSENMEALKHNFLFSGYFKKQDKKLKKSK